MDNRTKQWLVSSLAACTRATTAIAQALATDDDAVANAHMSDADKLIKQSQDEVSFARALANN